ncbi:hypothetical protein FB45DRAFT_910968, partial [Roridomyces roridus]
MSSSGIVGEHIWQPAYSGDPRAARTPLISMKLTYISGNVVLNTSIQVTYTVDPGESPPRQFLFGTLVNGVLSPVGPVAPVSGSGTFTITPEELGPQIIEAVLPFLNGGTSPYATGPTFTVVASQGLSSQAGSAPSKTATTSTTTTTPPPTSPSAQAPSTSSPDSTPISTPNTPSSATISSNRETSSPAAGGFSAVRESSVTQFLPISSNQDPGPSSSSSNLLVSSTNSSGTITQQQTSAPSVVMVNSSKASKHVDKAAFVGAGAGAATLLTLVLVILLVRRRMKRRSQITMQDTAVVPPPTRSPLTDRDVEPFLTAFPEMAMAGSSALTPNDKGTVATTSPTQGVEENFGRWIEHEGRMSVPSFVGSEDPPPGYFDTVGQVNS